MNLSRRRARGRIILGLCASFAACGAAAIAPLMADECPDALITAAVKSRLIADESIGAFKINVDTEQCVVTLKGCVDSADKIRRASALARKVKRVRSVHNRLSICGKK